MELTNVKEEVQEEKEEVQEEQEQIKTEVRIGKTADDKLYFVINGQADIITIEGLLQYGRRQMDKVWAAMEDNDAEN